MIMYHASFNVSGRQVKRFACLNLDENINNNNFSAYFPSLRIEITLLCEEPFVWLKIFLVSNFIKVLTRTSGTGNL